MIKFSIVVCAHNAESGIQRTLSCLITLNYDPSAYEVILVNNSSSDDTVRIAENFCCSASRRINFRVVNENLLGLSYARKRGVIESNGKYIVFCDDDNHLIADYLVVAENLLDTLGNKYLIGAAGIPRLDTNRPSEVCKLYSYGSMLAVGSQSIESEDVSLSRGWLYGAGLVVPRVAFDELAENGFQSMLTDRKGASLSTGGDVELCLALTLLGWKLYSSLDLTFMHEISSLRLTKAYLEGLERANLKANLKLKHYYLLRSRKFRLYTHFPVFYIKSMGSYLKDLLLCRPNSLKNLFAVYLFLTHSILFDGSELPFYLIHKKPGSRLS